MDLNPRKWFARRAPAPSAFGQIVNSLAQDPVAAVKVHPANPQSDNHLQYIGRNDAGVRVTHITAFQVATVWACMDVIAASIASSNWNVFSGVRASEGNKVLLENDSLQYILNERGNPEMTALSAKRAIMMCAIGFGTGYAEIEWDMAGRPVALWPIITERVEPRRDAETGRLFYRVTQDMMGGSVNMDPSDMLVVRGAGLTGLAGDDPIARAVQSIAMAIALDQFGAAYFGNGTQVGGILNATNKLDDPAYDRLVEQWNKKHAGARNANKTAVLDGGEVTYTPFIVNAKDSQVVESRNQVVEEVCRIFRVPPHKVGHLLRATNNNIEHQGLEFNRDTLRPWAQEIQQESTYKLIPYRTRKFIELDLDWASEGDYGSRMTAYSTARGMGVFSVNDVLRKLGENTIGPVGDVRTMNGASVRLEDVGKNMAPATPAAPEPVDTSDNAEAAWLGSIYARGHRRMQNRLTGRPAGEHAAIRSEALEYTVAEAKELAELLGGDVSAGAGLVLGGADPRDTAIETIMKIKEKR